MITGTRTHEAPHARMGGVWDFISATRLSLWLKCPLAFRYRYIDGIESPTTPSLFVGKRVHDALEVLYRHRQLGIELGLEDLADTIDRSWDEAAEEDELEFAKTDESEHLKRQTAGLVEAYLSQVEYKQDKPLAVETWLEADLVDPGTGENLGIPLVGVVDLILTGDSGPVVCDFKTSSRSSPPHEITHEIQLSCYAFLYRQLTGQQETALEIRQLIKTKTPKVQCHRYPARTAAHFRRLFAVLREYLFALENGSFNFRPGWNCGMCDFRDSPCGSWTGQESMPSE